MSSSAFSATKSRFIVSTSLMKTMGTFENQKVWVSPNFFRSAVKEAIESYAVAGLKKFARWLF